MGHGSPRSDFDFRPLRRLRDNPRNQQGVLENNILLQLVLVDTNRVQRSEFPVILAAPNLHER